MNDLTDDYIAIDTNVFEHLLNDEENAEKRIDDLLGRLFHDKISLIVDSGSEIEKEYMHRIKPMFRNSFEKGNRLQILRLWFVGGLCRRKIVDVKMNDQMMNIIKKILHGSGAVDTILVYVAFQKGRVLITNDKKDIVIGYPREKGERRNKLKKQTEKCRRILHGSRKCDKSDILTSEEAHKKL